MASQTYTALIDRTPPDMSLEGPLIDQRVAIGNNGVYDLTVEADDGAGRSGVEAIEIFVDSEQEPRHATEATCSDSDGSCPRTLSTTFQLDLSDELQELEDGTHTVHVVGRDAVGNVTANGGSNSFEIFVRSDEEAPTVEPSGTPSSTEPWTLTLEVEDESAASGMTPEPEFGAGVEYVEITAGGEVVATETQSATCPNGGCPLSVTTSVPAGTGVTTPARYRVVDKNGNVRNVVFGPVPTFPKFGYNDNFVGAAPGIDELKEMFHNAVSGGAGVIRIPVPWCVIEKDATGGPDWDHGFGFRLGKLFDEVKVANANGIEVQTLPVIFNAPDWAKGLPVDPHDDDPCGDNGPHDATHDGEWKDFVTAFLNRFGHPRGWRSCTRR